MTLWNPSVNNIHVVKGEMMVGGKGLLVKEETTGEVDENRGRNVVNRRTLGATNGKGRSDKEGVGW